MSMFFVKIPDFIVAKKGLTVPICIKADENYKPCTHTCITNDDKYERVSGEFFLSGILTSQMYVLSSVHHLGSGTATFQSYTVTSRPAAESRSARRRSTAWPGLLASRRAKPPPPAPTSL